MPVFIEEKKWKLGNILQGVTFLLTQWDAYVNSILHCVVSTTISVDLQEIKTAQVYLSHVISMFVWYVKRGPLISYSETLKPGTKSVNSELYQFLESIPKYSEIMWDDSVKLKIVIKLQHFFLRFKPFIIYKMVEDLKQRLWQKTQTQKGQYISPELWVPFFLSLVSLTMK